jgi:hypothetical protein
VGGRISAVSAPGREPHGCRVANVFAKEYLVYAASGCEAGVGLGGALRLGIQDSTGRRP